MLENFGQLKRRDIIRRFPSISVIMTLEFEGTSVINFKKPDQLARQLSASNAISTSCQKTCINDPDIPLPTSIKSSLRHQRIFNSAFPLFSHSIRQAEERGASVVVKI